MRIDMKLLIVILIGFLSIHLNAQGKYEIKLFPMAHEAIDTNDYLYFDIEWQFQVRVNKQVYLLDLEKQLNTSKQSVDDSVYWKIKKHPTNNNLSDYIDIRKLLGYNNDLFNYIIQGKVVIWDLNNQYYLNHFIIKEYSDSGTGGLEIFVEHIDLKVQEPTPPIPAFSICKKIERVY